MFMSYDIMIPNIKLKRTIIALRILSVAVSTCLKQYLHVLLVIVKPRL